MTIAASHAQRPRPEAPLVIGLALMVLAAGCSTVPRRQSPPASERENSVARVSLDPSVSPVPFRWLAADAVLVSADVGQRKLAGFGNYVDRAALKVERTRLSVWDDEAAWKLAAAGNPEESQAIAHKRAEYVKDPSQPDPVERFLVFGHQGDILYERDFRSYPLTELD
jgi:hypothetical protein